jgi:hypothetical protein
MTSYTQFCRNCRMRYDFADQIQVRYRHGDGEEYDTWVSGEEVLQRLRSDAAESKMEELRRLEWRQIRELRDRLPSEARDKLKSELQDRLADGLEEALGANQISQSLADALRGGKGGREADREIEWPLLITDQAFRDKVLELAWIQLEGSFPADGRAGEPDDWT